MANDFLPFAKPCISDEAIAEVIDCLKSGWITTGPRTKRFESLLQEFLGAPHVACLNSATAGLHLALLALDLQPGDEVITSSLTFVATLNTITLAGGKPVLVETDIATRNMDVTQLEQAITPKTRAIMPVHFAGLAVDLDPIYALAKKHNLRVIEDAAQAIGTKYKGKRLGSFGDCQVFSFHPNKNITTGEGGCVSTRDEDLIKKINVTKFHGIDREAFNRFAKNGNQEYDVITPGFKYNMLDMQAALGLHQLPMLDEFIESRRKRAMIYQEELKNINALNLPSLPDYEQTHAWHLYTVLLDENKLARNTFIEKMREKNIGIGLHYQPVHLFKYYIDRFGFKPGDFPHAEDCASRIASLPLFPGMTDNEQDYIITQIKSLFKES